MIKTDQIKLKGIYELDSIRRLGIYCCNKALLSQCLRLILKYLLLVLICFPLISKPIVLPLQFRPGQEVWNSHEVPELIPSECREDR